MPLVYQKRIKRKHLRDNPDVLFVFGDNYLRKGTKGQAANMPHGFQVWNCGIQHTAESAAQILELPVTVEVKNVCTARPKRK